MSLYIRGLDTMVKFHALALALLVAALPACTPTVATRGNMVTERMLGQITPGVSTRTEVLQALGSPTTMAPFDENKWYYIGQITEKRGIFDPSVEAEIVVVAEFDDTGTLTRVAAIDNKRQDVALSDRKTPTSGSEMTAIDQFLGNLGKFNKSGNPQSTRPGI